MIQPVSPILRATPTISYFFDIYYMGNYLYAAILMLYTHTHLPFIDALPETFQENFRRVPQVFQYQSIQ